RLVSSLSRDSSNPNEWNAFLFGSGSWREKTELRELPPKLRVGDLLILGDDLEAEIFEIDEKSNRLVKLRFSSSGNIWQKMYELGNPIQYSYLSHDLEIWDQQTIFSTVPISIEAPSASFQLRWDQYFALKDKGVEIVPITHAISLSNSGDEYFDSLLPFPERYWISESAARKLNSALTKGKNIVAAGTSVIRALESNGLLHNGIITATTEVTNLKIDQNFHRTIVNGLLTGMHLPDESHIQILLNFLDEEELLEAYDQAMNLGYLWHEYGDLTLIKN
ncbi:MAG: S-adenosylmethionine:tRNA ribosyltransferase-isomerase, partial [Candidatus Heimdallarchaeota archaeon]|nr:S-adenosylmethionine:tRNA ribosyltransferase-isomerase [Candidatus Heimdallarchaeota archaeon]